MTPEDFKPKSASVVRYEQMRAELARHRFYQNPEQEPEAIARHYVAHAMLALQLLEMIRFRQYGPDEDLDCMILTLTKQIKENHLHDFGIKLEWHPNSEKQR